MTGDQDEGYFRICGLLGSGFELRDITAWSRTKKIEEKGQYKGVKLGAEFVTPAAR